MMYKFTVTFSVTKMKSSVISSFTYFSFYCYHYFNIRCLFSAIQIDPPRTVTRDTGTQCSLWPLPALNSKEDEDIVEDDEPCTDDPLDPDYCPSMEELQEEEEEDEESAEFFSSDKDQYVFNHFNDLHVDLQLS